MNKPEDCDEHAMPDCVMCVVDGVEITLLDIVDAAERCPEIIQEEIDREFIAELKKELKEKNVLFGN